MPSVYRITEQCDHDVAVVFDPKHAVKVVSDLNRGLDLEDEYPYDILHLVHNGEDGLVWRFFSYIMED